MEVKLPNTIEQNIQHFTGRTWLLPQLLRWLEQTEDRMFMLTGEPGTGKSMIVAWLAGAGPMPTDTEERAQLEQIRSSVKAAHFCVTASGSVSPTNFAENVANQLTHNVSGFSDALAATLEDRVRISTVQQIGKMEAGSSATGVYIENLDLGELGEEFSFEQALHRPLRKLCANGYNKPILLLVDALDEAITYTGTIDLVRLLKKLSDLPQNVRVLVTTRPDPRVLKFYNKVKPFNLLTDAPEDVNDVRRYACERLAELEHEQRTRLSDRIAQAAQGIFLYAHLVINDLLARLPEIPDLNAISLPKGLSGVYHDFLNWELGSDENRWYPMFKPLLGLIAVAQGEGLTRMQIEHILSKDVEQPLRICKQYLSGNLPDGPFRPFHQSFADFLLRDEENIDYHIDALQMHRQIAEYYLKEYGSRWKDCDLYGLRYLPTHQIQAGLWEGLEQVLTDLRFIEVKCAAGMTYDLIADYNAALDGLPDPDAQRERVEKQQREARVQKYIKDLIAYAKGEIKELEIIDSVEPWGEERINADIERIKNNPTRLDRLRAFAQFVNSESHALVKFAPDFPGFCIQQAYNSADSGPVVRSAEGIVKTERENMLLLHHPSWRSAYNPHPALLKTIEGHTSIVRSVSITPDGRYAISGSEDRTLRVWDLEQNICRLTLTGHTWIVNAVSMTPDGRTAISGSYDHTVRVWDLTQGVCRQTLTGHTHVVQAVSVTPDGRTAVSGSYDHTLRIWDLEQGVCCQALTGHTDSVEAVSVTPDGRTAVSGSRDHTVRVWDLAQGLCRQTLSGHTDAVTAVYVTPDGRSAVSGDDHTLRVWDLEQGSCRQTLIGPFEAVSVTPDGCCVVSGGGYAHTVRVWDLAQNVCRQTLTGHTDSVQAVSVTPDGRYAVSGGGEDHTVRVWDLEHSGCHQTLTWDTGRVWTVRVTPNGCSAISICADQRLRVWDLGQGVCYQTLIRLTWIVGAVSVTPDGCYVISGSWDHTVRVGDLTQGACRQILTGHTDGVTAVSVTLDGRTAVSGSWDHTVRVWDLAQGLCCQTLSGHTDAVTAIPVTSDRCYVVSGSRDRTLRVWDLAQGVCRQTLNGHTDQVWTVSVTLDGRTAVSGSWDHTVRVWDLAQGVCRQNLSGHTDWVETVNVTPDSRYVISGGADQTLRVWDLKSGECFAIYQATSDITSVSEVRANGGFIYGTAAGEIILLRFHNFLMEHPIVTALRTWLYGENDNPGRWDENITTVCLWCGQRFPVAANLLDVIVWITRNANLSDDQSPCLELPQEAWDEPKLLSECPLCHQPLKFNPFVVDNRGWYG